MHQISIQDLYYNNHVKDSVRTGYRVGFLAQIQIQPSCKALLGTRIKSIGKLYYDHIAYISDSYGR
jgi:hypothetical protein